MDPSPHPRDQNAIYKAPTPPEVIRKPPFHKMNEELVASAVTFLRDPNVFSSPLAKKVEFLESKGLNQSEIEEALKRSNGDSSSSLTAPNVQVLTSPSQNTAYQPPVDYYNVNTAPAVPDRSWKDYLIMATATAGVGYGLYQVVSRYLVPALIPPTQSQIDQDKAVIDEEFVKIDKLLEQLQKDQDDIKQANDAKLKEVDTAIDNVNDFLLRFNKDKLKFDDDLRLMKLEIDNLQNSIEKNMRLTKENIKDELEDITEELASLKNLITMRGEASKNDAQVRKVAPVSSIPLASEIMRRAKANASPPQTSASTPAAAAATSTPILASEETPVEKSSNHGYTAPTTVNGVTAGGIPSWQMKHKELEEKQASKSAEDVVSESIAKIGAPSWQLNATTAEEKTKDQPKKDEPKVERAGGVPAWQLAQEAAK